MTWFQQFARQAIVWNASPDLRDFAREQLCLMHMVTYGVGSEH